MERSADSKPELFDSIVGTNLRGLFLVGTATARAMIDVGRGGSIINMSSILGQVAMQRTSIYVATKGALNQLTRSWALESAAHGIRVNALAPAYIVTSINEHLFRNEAYRRDVASRVPLGRNWSGGGYGGIGGVSGIGRGRLCHGSRAVMTAVRGWRWTRCSALASRLSTRVSGKRRKRSSQRLSRRRSTPSASSAWARTNWR